MVVYDKKWFWMRTDGMSQQAAHGIRGLLLGLDLCIEDSRATDARAVSSERRQACFEVPQVGPGAVPLSQAEGAQARPAQGSRGPLLHVCVQVTEEQMASLHPGHLQRDSA